MLFPHPLNVLSILMKHRLVEFAGGIFHKVELRIRHLEEEVALRFGKDRKLRLVEKINPPRGGFVKDGLAFGSV
jgi:hypothetical protein